MTYYQTSDEAAAEIAEKDRRIAELEGMLAKCLAEPGHSKNVEHARKLQGEEK